METEEVKRSSRDRDALRARMEAWLAGKLPDGAAPRIENLDSPSSNGLSSETLLFDAAWQEGGGERRGAFAGRLAPDSTDVPVFPHYDLESQFRLLEIVGRHSRVPVPGVRWLEPDPTPIGVPFFVMDRVEGRVPPDVMPYNFGSWLTEAAPEERRQLQDASVGVLADLHSIDPRTVDLSFLELDVPGDTPLRRHMENQRRYYAWARGERRHPVLERTFEWLESHWPKDEGDPVVSWGDARIGNIMYRGFEPVAVFDWEMAALGPRELDLGWMVFLHVFFEDIARNQMGLPGLPDFLRREDAVRHYEALTRHRVRDFGFYLVYAALRHGIVMTRVHQRRVHFGEAEWPDDPDEVIFHRALLTRMLDGEEPL